MKLFLRTTAVTAFAFAIALNPARAVLPPDSGDVVVNVDNSRLVKLSATDGTVLWSVDVANDGALAVDPNDFGVYTSLNAHNYGNDGTTYKFTADGTLDWTSSVSPSSYSVTPGARLNYAGSCEGYSDLNPVDGMLYRGGGETASGGCGPTIYQMNKFNLAATNWSMDLSSYIESVDALAVQPWEGGYLYAASAASSKIVVIDPATKSVVTSFDTEIPPRYIAVNPQGGNVYIADGQNPFVIAYGPTGTLAWVNLNLGGTVSNIATPKGIIGAPAIISPCPVPTVRISSDRNSIHKGESATITLDYGAGSAPPCQNVTVYFTVKTHAKNGVDFTFTDVNGQDATVVGAVLSGPLTLRCLYNSRNKTLPVNILLKKDPAYYLGNRKVAVELLAN